MNKFFYFFVTILSLFLLSTNVNADTTDNSIWEPYKEEANNVEIKYAKVYDEEGNLIKGKYQILVTGLSENLIVKVIDREDYYKKSNEINGVITINDVESGSIKVGIYHIKYVSVLLRYVTVNIPKFNEYSQREECIDKKDLDVCAEDYPYEISESTFLYKVSKYQSTNTDNTPEKENNKIIDFLMKYYIYIIGTIMIITSITLLIVWKKKKYSLE